MQECHRPENGTHKLASNQKTGLSTRQEEDEGVEIIVGGDGSVVIVIEDPEIVDELEDELKAELEDMLKEIEAEELDDTDDDDDDFDDMGSVMLAGFVLQPQDVPAGSVNLTLDHITYTAEFTCPIQRGYCCLGGLTSAGLGVNCEFLTQYPLLPEKEVCD